jgi:hypothetical protein
MIRAKKLTKSQGNVRWDAERRCYLVMNWWWTRDKRFPLVFWQMIYFGIDMALSLFYFFDRGQIEMDGIG